MLACKTTLANPHQSSLGEQKSLLSCIAQLTEILCDWHLLLADWMKTACQTGQGRPFFTSHSSQYASMAFFLYLGVLDREFRYDLSLHVLDPTEPIPRNQSPACATGWPAGSLKPKSLASIECREFLPGVPQTTTHTTAPAHCGLEDLVPGPGVTQLALLQHRTPSSNLLISSRKTQPTRQNKTVTQPT